MADSAERDDIAALRAQMEDLRGYVRAIETEAKAARQDASTAHEEVLSLRDQVAAAERDQQDLKTVRARLARRGLGALFARLLHH